jgi:hypothetical protein
MALIFPQCMLLVQKLKQGGVQGGGGLEEAIGLFRSCYILFYWYGGILNREVCSSPENKTQFTLTNFEAWSSLQERD